MRHPTDDHPEGGARAAGAPRDHDARHEDARRDDAGREDAGPDRPHRQDPHRQDPHRERPRGEDAPPGEAGGSPRAVPPPPRKRGFVLAALVLAALLGWGAYGHWQKSAAAAQTQRRTLDFVPQVRTVRAELADKPVELTLPGQTEAFETTAIFARATGYVAERRADIGTRVRRGDLLLRIGAPDLDQQLAQAEAQLGQQQALLVQARASVDQARASLNLANVTNSRTSTLAVQGWASKQNADTSQAGVLTQGATLAAAEAGVKVAEANLKAQGATVDRLRALTAFERVTAPFDGVVTARNVEVGNLVNADQGTGTPLFTMDRDDVLRVSVQVPQNAAVGVRDGIAAQVAVPQMPGRRFAGHVARSSVALRFASRTLVTEVDVANPDGLLRPGLYVSVTLAVPREQPRVKVPAEALVFNQNGLQVAVVQDDQTVQLRKVEVERDYGTTIELRDGLEGHERIVLAPPATLRDGSKVQAPDEPAKSASR
ncbi:Multidrug resistance protein MdtE [Methylobacterium crusticola]|uniref:Multidrug resistance protein MdtE n=1 Tax=Methylobacterium crusticola TaxID=1697972 RepID=A0ABQ4QYE6_9HYPH|nr:efflux RND transporter periplasmic adaptor subunit [Methylobacterium crusticola]GJD50081.1 Multidrug resistance protein MdtE [Methylobacterium crusticola]